MTATKKEIDADTRPEFEIKLYSEEEQNLAKVMFDQKPSLKNLFTESFQVLFTGLSDDRIFFKGTAEEKSKSIAAFQKLSGAFTSGQHITKNLIKQVSQQINGSKGGLSPEFKKKAANENESHKSKKGPQKFVPKNDSQAKLFNLIEDNDLTLALGPAGTGKTHVAVAKAVELFLSGKVDKILIARPAITAGEDIGFLPGDQNDKLKPFLQPVYDELEKVLGPEERKKLTNKNKIVVIPVGHMRGRTFPNCVLILDEAQNTTVEQIIMATTRMGEGSKIIISGDADQTDLKLLEDQESGIVYIDRILKGKPSIGRVEFKESEVIRSPLVKIITEAIAEEKAKKAQPKKVQPGPKQ